MSEYASKKEREQEIARRLGIIGRYYDLDAVASSGKGNREIARYYRFSDFYYNLVHSRGGHNIHMGLSQDGRFRKEDLLGQAQFVRDQIPPDARRVLEVGAGRAANTKYLADLFPGIGFTALDLPGRNLLRTRVPANVTLVEGDYNDLSSFGEASFDLVFGVETICHSADKERTFREISRVLRPGGKLVVFDVYEPLPKAEMTEFERNVNRITLAAMCVTDRDLFIGDTVRYLRENGFSGVSADDLTAQIRPSLARLDWMFGKWFRHPKIMRFLRLFIRREADRNSIAGWLMLPAFDGERMLQYDRVAAVKSSPSEPSAAVPREKTL
ncbi:MAG: methyltransferase domain-containing protein [Clostridiales bacterium]|nr:methyltransferase domain-containing protein [Clostridiales bacterium]